MFDLNGDGDVDSDEFSQVRKQSYFLSMVLFFYRLTYSTCWDAQNYNGREKCNVPVIVSELSLG